MTYLGRIDDYVPLSSLSNRDTRIVDILATSVVLGGAILGAGFGGELAAFAPLVAFLFGGFIYSWNRYRLDRELYGNVLLGLFFGTFLSWFVLSAIIALSLQLSIVSVIWAIAIPMLMNVTLVSVVLLVGFAAALVFGSVGLPDRDVTALLLLVAGAAGFAFVQMKLGALMPNCGQFCRPMLSHSAYTRYLGFQIGGIITAGAGFVGFLGLIRSRSRLRAVMGGLVVLGLIIGTSGVGNVYAQIKYSEAATTVGSRVSIAGERFSVGDDTIVVVIEVSNPSSETVVVSSGYFRASTPTDARIAYGAGQLKSGDVQRIPPGETAMVAYRIELTDSQARRIHRALRDGGFTLSGKITLRLQDVGGAAVSAFGDRSGFVIRFDCGITADSIECTTV